MCTCACVHAYRYSQRLEGIGSSGTRVQMTVSFLMWVLGVKLGSSARTVCPLDISLVLPHHSSNFLVSASQGEKGGHNEWTHFPMPGSCSQTSDGWHHCTALVKASHLYHEQKQVRAVCGHYTQLGRLDSGGQGGQHVGITPTLPGCTQVSKP